MPDPSEICDLRSMMPEGLAAARVLTEVRHLERAMLPDGTFRDETERAVLDQLVTKVKEDGMPKAVSHVWQEAVEVRDEVDAKRRIFLWSGIGTTALSSVDVAQSGYNHHFSEPALRRVAIEVAEAERKERELTPGTFQIMVSPRMTESDAPRMTARAEHLDADDAVRVMRATTDDRGEVTGCETISLLVRDIPIGAWVALLRDPQNPWGKSFEITDPSSALSVMSLFDQLDIDEGSLPEGPISLVAAVVPYIGDPLSRLSVERQLEGYRGNQWELDAEARAIAIEYLGFEKELARSLREGHATFAIRRFIIGLQDNWDDQTLRLLESQQVGNGEWGMNDELAAHLEMAKQLLVGRMAKINTLDDAALLEMGEERAQALRREKQEIRILRSMGVPEHELAAREAELERTYAASNIPAGGGCNNDITSLFKGQGSSPNAPDAKDKKTEEGVGKKKVGVCRIGGCPSRPGETLVGGCKICIKNCQPLFDAGVDPAKIYVPEAEHAIDDVPEVKSEKSEGATTKWLAGLALAA